MQSFIDKQIVSIQRKARTGRIDDRQCMVIEAVAMPSVAATAGIRQGDLLLAVNDVAAASCSFTKMVNRKSRYRYTFFSPARAEEITLVASGIPLGLKMNPSTAAIKQTFSTPQWSYENLEVLWQRGEWRMLEQIARKLLRPGLLGVIRLARQGVSAKDSPGLVMLGAALCEQSKWRDGIKLIGDYCQNYEKHWTTEYQAIARYYLAQAALQQGDHAAAIRLLNEAFDLWPQSRFSDALEKLTHDRPQEEKWWIGQRFPVNYSLRIVDNTLSLSLEQQLNRMATNQLMIVCLLANYRANGPYYEFMVQYVRLSTFFRDYLTMLHVITMNPETTETNPVLLRGEAFARHMVAPMALLYDSDGRVTWQLNPKHSPELFILNTQGQILHQGALDEVGFWTVLREHLSTYG